MKLLLKKLGAAFLAVLICFGLTACASHDNNGLQDNDNANQPLQSDSYAIDEDGVYTSSEDIALYIQTFNRLPDNFITKKEAQNLGWNGGSLEPYAPGKCIGGDKFGNYEGILPKENGRQYYECDVDTLGADSRGAKRIVYSNDGLIYYTEDHYDSFKLLYGDPFEDEDALKSS